MRKKTFRAAVAAALAFGMLALTSCAHKDLTAPCTRDGSLWGIASAFAAPSDCGPLLPVNR
jgi:hypothetical protein